MSIIIYFYLFIFINSNIIIENEICTIGITSHTDDIFVFYDGESYKINNPQKYQFIVGDAIVSFESKDDITCEIKSYSPKKSIKAVTQTFGSVPYSYAYIEKVPYAFLNVYFKGKNEAIPDENVRSLAEILDYTQRLWTGNRFRLDLENSYYSSPIPYTNYGEGGDYDRMMREISKMAETLDNNRTSEKYGSKVYLAGSINTPWSGIGIVGSPQMTYNRRGYWAYVKVGPGNLKPIRTVIHECAHNIGFMHASRIKRSLTGMVSTFLTVDDYSNGVSYMGGGGWRNPPSPAQYYNVMVRGIPEEHHFNTVREGKHKYRIFAWDHPYSRYFIGNDYPRYNPNVNVDGVLFKNNLLSIIIPFDKTINSKIASDTNEITVFLDYRFYNGGLSSAKNKGVRIIYGQKNQQLVAFDGVLDLDVERKNGNHVYNAIVPGVTWFPDDIDLGTILIRITKQHSIDSFDISYDMITSEKDRELSETAYMELEIEYRPGVKLDEKYKKESSLGEYIYSSNIINCEYTTLYTCHAIKNSNDYWLYLKDQNVNVPRCYTSNLLYGRYSGKRSYNDLKFNHCYGDGIPKCHDVEVIFDIDLLSDTKSIQLYYGNVKKNINNEITDLGNNILIYFNNSITTINSKCYLSDIYNNSYEINCIPGENGDSISIIPFLQVDSIVNYVVYVKNDDKIVATKAGQINNKWNSERVAFNDLGTGEYNITAATIRENTVTTMIKERILKADEEYLYPIENINKNSFIYIDFIGSIPNELIIKVVCDMGTAEYNLKDLHGFVDISYKITGLSLFNKIGFTGEINKFIFNKDVTILNIRPVYNTKQKVSELQAVSSTVKLTVDDIIYDLSIKEDKNFECNEFTKNIKSNNYKFTNAEEYTIKLSDVTPPNNNYEEEDDDESDENEINILSGTVANIKIFQISGIESCNIFPFLPDGLSLSHECVINGMVNPMNSEKKYIVQFIRECNVYEKEIIIKIHEDLEYCDYGLENNEVFISKKIAFTVSPPLCNTKYISCSSNNLPNGVKINKKCEIYTIGPIDGFTNTEINILIKGITKQIDMKLKLKTNEVIVNKPFQHLQYEKQYYILPQTKITITPSMYGKATECSATNLPDGFTIDNNCQIIGKKTDSTEPTYEIVVTGKNTQSSSKTKIIFIKNDINGFYMPGLLATYYSNIKRNCTEKFVKNKGEIKKYDRIEYEINDNKTYYWPEISWRLEKDSVIKRSGFIYIEEAKTIRTCYSTSGTYRIETPEYSMTFQKPFCGIYNETCTNIKYNKIYNTFALYYTRVEANHPINDSFYLIIDNEYVLVDQTIFYHKITDYMEYAYPYANYPYMSTIDDNIPVFHKSKESFKGIFSITPELPSGLYLNITNGVISGNAFELSEKTTYLIKCRSDTNEIITANIIIEISEYIGESFKCENNNNNIECNDYDVETDTWFTNNLPHGLIMSDNIISGTLNKEKSYISQIYRNTIDGINNVTLFFNGSCDELIFVDRLPDIEEVHNNTKSNIEGEIISVAVVSSFFIVTVGFTIFYQYKKDLKRKTSVDVETIKKPLESENKISLVSNNNTTPDIKNNNALPPIKNTPRGKITLPPIDSPRKTTLPTQTSKKTILKPQTSKKTILKPQTSKKTTPTSKKATPTQNIKKSLIQNKSPMNKFKNENPPPPGSIDMNTSQTLSSPIHHNTINISVPNSPNKPLQKKRTLTNIKK